MSRIVIRLAMPFDLPEIVTLQRAAIGTTASHYGAEELAAWAAGPTDGLRALVAAGRYRVADRGGTLLGGAGWEEGADGASATIRAVFVHPAAHGRGIGAALVTAIEEEFARRGIFRLIVPAALNAVGFYQRLGYVPLERRVAELDGVRLPYQQMLKQAA
jgi:GNAT superfamily N-acetyltransferase